ncbi:hypothetical protein AB4Y96_16845 [Phyllobacterium sp. TAF24]|uniref:hypothetical protein n=1 Tax=Phyllobacterium sp. TAF24 TaxID=3233068 RepID=UPI003F96558F
MANLQSHDGVDWKMALGELQLHFNEACFWILVDKAESSGQSLIVFREQIKGFKNKWDTVKCTVSFSAIEENEKLFIEYLEGDEIYDEEKLKEIGSRIDREPLRDDDIFVSVMNRNATSL